MGTERNTVEGRTTFPPGSQAWSGESRTEPAQSAARRHGRRRHVGDGDTYRLHQHRW